MCYSVFTVYIICVSLIEATNLLMNSSRNPSLIYSMTHFRSRNDSLLHHKPAKNIIKLPSSRIRTTFILFTGFGMFLFSVFIGPLLDFIVGSFSRALCTIFVVVYSSETSYYYNISCLSQDHCFLNKNSR